MSRARAVPSTSASWIAAVATTGSGSGSLASTIGGIAAAIWPSSAATSSSTTARQRAMVRPRSASIAGRTRPAVTSSRASRASVASQVIGSPASSPIAASQAGPRTVSSRAVVGRARSTGVSATSTEASWPSASGDPGHGPPRKDRYSQATGSVWRPSQPQTWTARPSHVPTTVAVPHWAEAGASGRSDGTSATLPKGCRAAPP